MTWTSPNGKWRVVLHILRMYRSRVRTVEMQRRCSDGVYRPLREQHIPFVPQDAWNVYDEWISRESGVR